MTIDRAPKLPLLARALRWYLRSNVRGQTRIAPKLTNLAARYRADLQIVPIQIEDWAPVYMDLRQPNAVAWLRGSPWESSPREDEEQAVMRCIVRPGDVVFDIGANIGLHTALLSRLVGRHGKVYAFEPNLEIIPLLGRTLGAMPNATLVPVALSDRVADSVLYVPGLSEAGSLADWTAGQYGDTHKVRCEERTLDSLIHSGSLPTPHFIKCDVEGGELKVFQGGRNCLDAADAPIVLFEANVYTSRGFSLNVSAAKAFLESLERASFKFYSVGAGGELAVASDLHPVHSNVLAVPRCKRQQVV
jgi:FkbM family methyltransferase